MERLQAVWELERTSANALRRPKAQGAALHFEHLRYDTEKHFVIMGNTGNFLRF